MVLDKHKTKDTHFKIRINKGDLAELAELAKTLNVSLADLFREGAQQLARSERRKLKKGE